MPRLPFCVLNLTWLLASLFFVPTALAQSFDERMEDWPIDTALPGTVMASSAVTLSESTLAQFAEYAQGDEADLVTIRLSTAAPDIRIDDLQDGTERPGVFQFDPTQGTWSPDPGDDSRPNLSAALKKATGVLLLSDGNLELTSRQKLMELAPQLREVVQRGGVVLGNKGVSRMMGSVVAATEQKGEQELFSRGPGLGLLPDVVLHNWNEAGDQIFLQATIASRPRTIGIGIEPDTTLVLRGRKIRALDNGTLHFLAAANQELPIRYKAVSGVSGRRFNPYRYLVDLTAWRRDAIDRTLETFPPAEPATPHVENGTLLIIGGGGLPEGMMQQFVELAGGQDARLVYIPCKEQEETGRRDRGLIQSWEQMGVASADLIHTKDRNRANTDEAILGPLRNATGIFFGGGRQWNFSDSWYGTEAHRLMKEVLDRGGVIAGSSAGASIQARYLARANPLGNIDIMAPGYERGGLGFISGVAIDQHFTQRGRQKDMTQLVNRYPQLLGIGIDEGTAIVVQKSIAEVVGRGDVYFYDRSQIGAHENPDYLKVSRGEKFDLAKRKVVSQSDEQQD